MSDALTYQHIDHEALHLAIQRQREALQGDVQPRTSALLSDTESRIQDLDAGLTRVREARVKLKSDIEALQVVYNDMLVFEQDAAIEMKAHMAIAAILRDAQVTK